MQAPFLCIMKSCRECVPCLPCDDVEPLYASPRVACKDVVAVSHWL